MKNDGETSTRELASHLGQQLTKLVSLEVALAKAELSASVRQTMQGGGLFGGAGVVAHTAWLVFAAAAVAGIAVVLPVWASALIVGGALALVAGVLALMGRRKIRRGNPPLKTTTNSVKTDLGELASATSSARDSVRDSVTSHGNGHRVVPAPPDSRPVVPAQRDSRTPVEGIRAEDIRPAVTPGGRK